MGRLNRQKGIVKVEITGLQEGKYDLEIYKVGYKVNDVYSDYLAMGRPNQLTKQQVETLKKLNDGTPISTEKIILDSKGGMERILMVMKMMFSF